MDRLASNTAPSSTDSLTTRLAFYLILQMSIEQQLLPNTSIISLSHYLYHLIDIQPRLDVTSNVRNER